MINSLARRLHLQVRERKMDFGIMVGSALEPGTAHRKEHMVTIESLRLQYEKDSGVHISSKCFHNRLDQSGLSDFGTELVTAAVKAYGALCGRSPDNYRKELIDALGVSDIILVDGTEISVRNSLSRQCERKGKLHAGLKLHVAFSLKKQSFEYINVTQAVDSGRAEVSHEHYKNVLFIMDAGYCGHELEERIVKSGNHYLIKGKTNMAGNVTKAFDGKGRLIRNCSWFRVSAAPQQYDACPQMDLQVNECSDKPQRIIRVKNQCRDGNERFAFPRASLTLKQANACQLHQLYRLRRVAEHTMKCLKSGNGLQGINSSKREIALFWICICALCPVLRSMISLIAANTRDKPFLSMLKAHMSPHFQGFFNRLITLKDSACYELRQNLIEKIVTSCQRTKPSQRDSLCKKDVALKIETIIQNESVTDRSQNAS